MKNDPALQVSWSASSSTMPLAPRSSSTAARTSAAGTRSPTSTPSVGPARRSGSAPTASPSGSWKVTAKIRYRSGSALNRRSDSRNRSRRRRRWPAVRSTGPRCGPTAMSLADLGPVRADVLDRRGTDQARDAGQASSRRPTPRSTASRDQRVPVSPAATVTTAPEQPDTSASMPRVATCTTVPSKPSSPISTLEPPPRTAPARRPRRASATDGDQVGLGLGRDQPSAPGRPPAASCGGQQRSAVPVSSGSVHSEIDVGPGGAEHLLPVGRLASIAIGDHGSLDRRSPRR